MEKETNTTETQVSEGSGPQEVNGTHEGARVEAKLGDRGQRSKSKATMGPFKPKYNIKPRVVLNDPALQEHRDHMATYAVICKFMGIWLTDKALYT